MLLGGAFAVGYALTPVPEPSAFGQKATTVVYYADGTTEMGRFADVNRTPVASGAIADSMKQAMVAAEDRSFYDNHGVSPTGVLRAFWSNLQGNATQGGSTITQQYVKNYYTDDRSRTLLRKAREAFIALKVDQRSSKDEILTNYLNTIYFGRGAYGVQEAAEAYFGVDAADLTTSQAALLAGVAPAPSTYDPAVDPDAAHRRWAYVVDGLVATGAVDQATADSLEFPEVRERQESQTFAGPKGYVLQTVRTELLAAGLSEEDLDSGGLRITTTVDQDMQEAAVETVHDEDYTDGKPEDVQTALVSIDPQTGGIRAMYGGDDYLERSQNAVTQDVAQAGSTFKPFALVAALEGDSHDGSDGISLETVFDGDSHQYFDFYTDGDGDEQAVDNFSDRDFGYIDLVDATEDSVNTVYVPLNEAAGPDHTVDVAVRAGLPADTKGLAAVPSNVLGSASPHPLDMARAFSTWAAQGKRTTPHVVEQVTGPSGDVLYTGDTSGEQVFDKDVIADATYAMSQVISSGGTAPEAMEIDRPAAGKTGTSENNKSAWFAGFTPQLATVVAIYAPGEGGQEGQLTPGWGMYSSRDAITGGSFPVHLWTEYMQDALEGEPVLDLPERADVGIDGGPDGDVGVGWSSSSSDDSEDSGDSGDSGDSEDFGSSEDWSDSADDWSDEASGSESTAEPEETETSEPSPTTSTAPPSPTETSQPSSSRTAPPTTPTTEPTAPGTADPSPGVTARSVPTEPPHTARPPSDEVGQPADPRPGGSGGGDSQGRGGRDGGEGTRQGLEAAA